MSDQKKVKTKKNGKRKAEDKALTNVLSTRLASIDATKKIFRKANIKATPKQILEYSEGVTLHMLHNLEKDDMLKIFSSSEDSEKSDSKEEWKRSYV
ncbi:hypothetical protein ACFLQI_01565 [Candidatus Undinarchaeota archaeon]